MSSITVQQTGFGIVVAEDGDTEATALLDGLPPLRAARYLTATPALRQALRAAEPALVDAVRPHLDGTVVVPDDGLAADLDGDATTGSLLLAQALGVSVIAPAGRFIRCDGTLFSVGGGDGWVAQSPRGARVPAGRRYPAPAWQSQLPHDLAGAAHIPAGLWITSGTDPRHAVRLARIAVRERQLLVVVGSPAETPPTRERLLALLRSIPAEARSSIVLAGFGSASLPLATVRALAVELDQPLRVAHGVELSGAPVRIDGDAETLPATLALESVCAPDGTVTLERWAPPPGLVADTAARYRLGESRMSRGRPGDAWVADVVAAGIVVHPVNEPLVDVAELQPPVGSLGVFLQCDGAYRPEELPALLAPLRARLEERGAVTLHPLDAAARRGVRDAYPGLWAPTEALAITADGRLVAATADASGDTDLPVDDSPVVESPADDLSAVVDEDAVAADSEAAEVAGSWAEAEGAAADAVESDDVESDDVESDDVESDDVESDAGESISLEGAPSESASAEEGAPAPAVVASAVPESPSAESPALETAAPESTASTEGVESDPRAEQQDAPTEPQAQRAASHRDEAQRPPVPTVSAPDASAVVDAVVGAEPSTPSPETSAPVTGRRARRVALDELVSEPQFDPSAESAAVASRPAAVPAVPAPVSTDAPIPPTAQSLRPAAPEAATASAAPSTTPSATSAAPTTPTASTTSAVAAAPAAPTTPAAPAESASPKPHASTPPASTTHAARREGGSFAPQAPTAAAAAAPVPTPSAAPSDRTPGDALARALQGSAATRLLGAAPRDESAADRAAALSSAASTPTAPTAIVRPGAPTTPLAGSGTDAAAPAATAAPAPSSQVTATDAAPASSAAERPEPTPQAEQSAQPAAASPAPHPGEAAVDRPQRSTPDVDVPVGASSTSEQRHRVRTALGSRYDVASRTVSQLLAQQPGMRVAAGDRSAMLTGLSLVRVFATEPHGEYDLDFHTCLAEGLAMLPTARSVVVRGIPAGIDATPGSTLRLRAPLVAAAADGPAAGPAEALIWTTSGRRLDRVLHGSAGAADVVLPAGARLCVLGTTGGSAPRLLLAEEGADAELALARLHAAAEARGDLGAHDDDRWFGDLPSAA
ncbi:hypothetical protein GCM10027515_09220 [Schumannella luteola]|uniref:Uncharacterized protein n=1 Tax=Schumannella luteola TaxID=472059 RepID=A0A852Y9R9_9MICO|nr:hypothetical protein [Schumannella luteola]NYG97951.1 hypothetical protein [Schumannella luteola]TPX01693.1 hypothetical protein FJ656_25145 [Schumannella luteola]